MQKTKNIKKVDVKPTKTVILNTHSGNKITVQRPVEKQGRSKGYANLEKGKWKKGQSGNPK